MLTDAQKHDIDRFRRKRYSSRDICRMAGVTDQQLQDYISEKRMATVNQPQVVDDPTPEEIAAATAKLKAEQLARLRQSSVNGYYERMPRHCCPMPDFRS